MENKLIITGLDTSVANTSNGNGAINFYDGYIDSQGFFNRRPGLSTITSISADSYGPPTGIQYWSTFNTNIVFFENKLYTLDSSNVITYRGDLSTHSGSTSARVYTSIARITGQEVMVCSRGTDMDVYNPVTHSITHIVPSVSGAPSNVLKTQYMDGYVICQVTTGNRFYWSELDDPTTWNPLDFAEAITVADDIKSIVVRNGKLYIFGEQSIELFQNDGVSPFSRLDGGQENVGTLASESVINTESGIFFLDSNKRVVRMNESGMEILSGQVDKLIETFAVLSDAYFHQININGKSFLLCFFPSAGVRNYWDGGIGTGFCLVYDINLKLWGEWTSWITTVSPSREMFRVRHHTYAVAQKRNIFLINNLARPVAELSNTTYQERGLESTPYSPNNPEMVGIHSEYQTGYNNWDIGNKKSARKLKIKHNVSPASSVLSISVNNGDGSTITPRLLELSGNYTGINETYTNQLGQYYQRSYKFENSSNSAFVFGNIIEDIMGLGQK
jgi:hypothetical protein